MALIACPKCNSEDINGTPQADSRLLIHCNDCGTSGCAARPGATPAGPPSRPSSRCTPPSRRRPTCAPTSASGWMLLQVGVPARPARARPGRREVPRPLPGALQPRGPAHRAARRALRVRQLRHRRQRRQHVRLQPRLEDPGPRQGRADRSARPSTSCSTAPRACALEDRLTQLIDGKKASASRRSKGAAAHQGALRRRARPVPAGAQVLGGDRRQEGDRQAGLRPRPAAGREGRLDDRPPGRLEQRPAALAGRQRHPRPAARDAVPGLGAHAAGRWRGTKRPRAPGPLPGSNRPWSGGGHTPPPSEGRAP